MIRAARLGALAATLVVVQVAVFPHLRLFGVVPDLGLVLAVAVGFRRGPEAGALVGFLAGAGFDLFLTTPLGLNALSYALVGYYAGLFAGGLLRAPRGLPAFLVLVGGAAGGLLMIGIGVLAGVDAVKGTQAVRVVALAAVYDAALAPVVFALVGAVLGRTRPAPASVWIAE